MSGPAHAATLLVCVYYRVAAGDAERVISAVREFQRTLPDGMGVSEPQVLLRCGLPRADVPSADRFALPLAASDASSDPELPSDRAVEAAVPGGSVPDPDSDPEPTLMETYRLALPDRVGSRASQAAVRALLGLLEAAAAPLAGQVLGARHVELFAPCAS